MVSVVGMMSWWEAEEILRTHCPYGRRVVFVRYNQSYPSKTLRDAYRDLIYWEGECDVLVFEVVELKLLLIDGFKANYVAGESWADLAYPKLWAERMFRIRNRSVAFTPKWSLDWMPRVKVHMVNEAKEVIGVVAENDCGEACLRRSFKRAEGIIHCFETFGALGMAQDLRRCLRAATS